METEVIKNTDEVHEAAKAYASERAEWWTEDWDKLRIAFEAGAKFQKELSHT
jgi:hypothetical protein